MGRMWATCPCSKGMKSLAQAPQRLCSALQTVFHMRGKWCKKPAKRSSRRAERQHFRLPFRHVRFWWWLSRLWLQFKKLLADYWTGGLAPFIFLETTAIKINNILMKGCVCLCECICVFPLCSTSCNMKICTFWSHHFFDAIDKWEWGSGTLIVLLLRSFSLLPWLIISLLFSCRSDFFWTPHLVSIPVTLNPAAGPLCPWNFRCPLFSPSLSPLSFPTPENSWRL